jgi:hypothetical protein
LQLADRHLLVRRVGARVRREYTLRALLGCTALWGVTPAGGDALGSAPTVADKFLYVGGMTLHAFAR